jgi:predicted O-linked N-acetylglucosamine transferase (SPINDLY family)
MDYFISSDAGEPENGQDHYLEKLVRLKSPIIHFTPPLLSPEPKERVYFGFTEADHIYACPQSIHKIHPDMDEIIGGILRRYPAGQVALLEGRTLHWTEAMTRRLRAKLPDVAGRIRMLARMTKEDFSAFYAFRTSFSTRSIITGEPLPTTAWPPGRPSSYGRAK